MSAIRHTDLCQLHWVICQSWVQCWNTSIWLACNLIDSKVITVSPSTFQNLQGTKVPSACVVSLGCRHLYCCFSWQTYCPQPLHMNLNPDYGRCYVHILAHTHICISQIQLLSTDSCIWNRSNSKHHTRMNDITNISDMIQEEKRQYNTVYSSKTITLHK